MRLVADAAAREARAVHARLRHHMRDCTCVAMGEAAHVLALLRVREAKQMNGEIERNCAGQGARVSGAISFIDDTPSSSNGASVSE